MLYEVMSHKCDLILCSTKGLVKKHFNTQFIHITLHIVIKHVACSSTSWQLAYCQKLHLVSHTTIFYRDMALWTYVHCNAVYTIAHCVQGSSIKVFEKKRCTNISHYSNRNNVFSSISLVLRRNGL
jgi:hypothetical protein